MNLIHRLFLKLAPDPLAPLRLVDASNEKDLALLHSLHDEAQRARDEEHAARNAAANDPTPENFQRANDLGATLPARLGAIGANGSRAAITIRSRVVKRTLPVLVAALPAVKERLEMEKKEVLELEAKIAARVGVGVERESAALSKLNEEIRRCDNFARTLTGYGPEDYDAVQKVLRFALGQ